MHANIGTDAIGVERCVSCDAPLAGPYCARCGERALEPEALTLRHFLVHTSPTSSCMSMGGCGALCGFMTAVQVGGAAVALALA